MLSSMPIGKMVQIDLLKVGLPQTFNLFFLKKSVKHNKTRVCLYLVSQYWDLGFVICFLVGLFLFLWESREFQKLDCCCHLPRFSSVLILNLVFFSFFLCPFMSLVKIQFWFISVRPLTCPHTLTLGEKL